MTNEFDLDGPPLAEDFLAHVWDTGSPTERLLVQEIRRLIARCRRVEAMEWWKSCTPEERAAADFYADLDGFRRRAEQAERDLATARELAECNAAAFLEADQKRQEAEREAAELRERLVKLEGPPTVIETDDGHDWTVPEVRKLSEVFAELDALRAEARAAHDVVEAARRVAQLTSNPIFVEDLMAAICAYDAARSRGKGEG